ncbi:MAG TPA: hypothetical protein VE173_06310, partial [Longimicrobiales bacterium]|nr:hypothetical protein [Longimicrobiales bacterium]
RLVEDVRVGSLDDPDVGFSNITGVDVDRDGFIYVLERMDREIRVYDPEGRRVRTIGGPGRGPGEFERPTLFGVLGDTVWVNDTGLDRLTLFSRGGDLISTHGGMAIQIDVPGIYVTIGPGRMRSDRLLETRLGSLALPSGARPSDIVVPRLLLDLDGTVVDTIGADTMSLSDMFSQDRPRFGGITFMPPGAAPDTPYTLTADDGTIRVERPRPLSGDPSTFTVTRTRTGGDTVYGIRFRYTPRPYQGAVIDSLVAERSRLYEERVDDPEGLRNAMREALDLPAFQAPITSGLLGRDGSALLSREDEGAGQTWIVIDSAGTPAGRFHLPRTSTIRWVRGDRMWIVEHDEFEVQWLVRYLVRR